MFLDGTTTTVIMRTVDTIHELYRIQFNCRVKDKS
jgi:hypothetical protein